MENNVKKDDYQVTISLKTIALCGGCVLGGMLIGGAIKENAIAKVKKSIINDVSKSLRKDVVNEVKTNVLQLDVSKIKSEIKSECMNNVVSNLKEYVMRDSKELCKSISNEFDSLKRHVDNAVEETLNSDAQIGRFVTNSINTIASRYDKKSE